MSAKEAKLLLKGDDELILSVYDYWIDRRLRLKQPLIPTVKSDKRDLVRLLFQIRFDKKFELVCSTNN